MLKAACARLMVDGVCSVSGAGCYCRIGLLEQSQTAAKLVCFVCYKHYWLE